MVVIIGILLALWNIKRSNRSHDFTDHIYDVPIATDEKNGEFRRKETTVTNSEVAICGVLSPCEMKSNIAYGHGCMATSQQMSTDVLATNTSEA